ncbi:MAG: 16S rRNA (uracil(1498)-N(3))-methyltransferase, partial [Proteobacteria bacterium]
MSNIRLFFKESLSLNLVSKLDKSQSHYISKVMRIKENEIFSLFNSSGEWEAKVLNITKSIVEFEITNQIRQKENQKELWLAFSPIKSNYFNFMIQKATELGITKFVPIIFERTVVRKLNKERLEKVIIEATEQSNRINIPTLEDATNLEDFLKSSEMNLIFTDLNSD